MKASKFPCKIKTIDYFNRFMPYSCTSGELTWTKRPPRSRVKVGSRAGCVASDSYRVISISGTILYEHRFIWLINYGEWPDCQIDHINGDKSDNRISNLRLASVSENAENRCSYRNSKSGLMGASKVKGYDLWASKIVKNGNKIHLGYFKSPESAHAAYVKAKMCIHKFNPVIRNKDMPNG